MSKHKSQDWFNDFISGNTDNPWRIAAKTMGDYKLLKQMYEWTEQHIDDDYIEFSVSPRDDIIDNMLHEDINKKLRQIMTRKRVPFLLVGEWSRHKHRWHYHGIMKAKDMDVVTSVRRAITRAIGRVNTGMIKYTQSYAKYMYKIYMYPLLQGTIQPFWQRSYITNIEI